MDDVSILMETDAILPDLQRPFFVKMRCKFMNTTCVGVLNVIPAARSDQLWLCIWGVGAVGRKSKSLDCGSR
jgi:hypothetical protein